MLGIEHITYMGVILIITIILHKLIKRNNIDFDKYLKYTAVISLFLDPIYWVWEYFTYGYFSFDTTLPLYICSLFWMVYPIVAFSKKRGNLYRSALSSLLTIVFFGAILGMVFNTHIGNYGFWHFRVQMSLFYHSLMMISITLIWTSGYYKFESRDRYLFPIPLLLLMIPSYIVDSLYGYDYCYFNGGKGTVLQYFSDFLGIPLFVIVFYTILFTIAFGILSAARRVQSK